MRPHVLRGAAFEGKRCLAPEKWVLGPSHFHLARPAFFVRIADGRTYPRFARNHQACKTSALERRPPQGVPASAYPRREVSDALAAGRLIPGEGKGDRGRVDFPIRSMLRRTNACSSCCIWTWSNSPHSASSAKVTKTPTSLSGPKSSRKAGPNSANSRIFQRWQNLAMSFLGIVAIKSLICLRPYCKGRPDVIGGGPNGVSARHLESPRPDCWPLLCILFQELVEFPTCSIQGSLFRL